MFAVSSLIRKIQSFRQDRQGMVAIIFGLAILPIMMTMGIAIDHSGAQRARNKMQSAADAAVLTAVTTGQKLDGLYGAADSPLHATAKLEAEAQARAMFIQALIDDKDVLTPNLVVDLTKDVTKNSYSVVATYTGQYKLTMPNPIGLAAMDVAGRSESSLATSGQGYMEISTLLDVSPSMGIGASPNDIQILQNRPNNSCAFTCHHGENTNGAVLRIDVLRTALSNMISEAQSSVGPDNIKRIRIALNRFEGTQTVVEPITDNYNALAAKVSQIKINQDGTESSDIGGAVNWITPLITQSGDGKTAANPKKFVFLVTDGMEDRAHHYRPQNFLGPTSYFGHVGTMNPAYCDALKAKGVTVAVLYTTYYFVGYGTAWAYLNTLPSVPSALQSCASPGFFFEAQNAAQMQTEFKKMFKKATSTAGVRLTK